MDSELTLTLPNGIKLNLSGPMAQTFLQTLLATPSASPASPPPEPPAGNITKNITRKPRAQKAAAKPAKPAKPTAPASTAATMYLLHGESTPMRLADLGRKTQTAITTLLGAKERPDSDGWCCTRAGVKFKVVQAAVASPSMTTTAPVYTPPRNPFK